MSTYLQTWASALLVARMRAQQYGRRQRVRKLAFGYWLVEEAAPRRQR